MANNLVYSNGIKFKVKDGVIVLDVIEDATNTEVIEREYKGSCCHPSVHYNLYIVLSYNGKTYRLTISSKESNTCADVNIEMFTELGFKQIANVSTLGYGNVDNVHHLYWHKTTEEQRSVARGIVERMIDYITFLG